MVQWLRLHTFTAGGSGSIPGQGTRSHMPQLKMLSATIKTQHSQKMTSIKKKYRDFLYTPNFTFP